MCCAWVAIGAVPKNAGFVGSMVRQFILSLGYGTLATVVSIVRRSWDLHSELWILKTFEQEDGSMRWGCG
jgi:hypothetical protein